MWFGVMWCGVVWYDVVWCDVAWYGVVRCGVVWCGVERTRKLLQAGKEDDLESIQELFC